MKVKKFNLLIISAIILSLALVACGTSFNKKSYQAMGAMSVTYDTAMKSAADLYRKGLISEEGKQAIITAATSYHNAHEQAITAFQEYLSAPPEQQADKKQQYITVAKVSLAAYGELLAVLTKFGVYGEPVQPWF